MKVILLTDVAKVGHKHDVKEVSAGYAVNFLFPHKLAMPASGEAEKKLQAQKNEIEKERKIQNDVLLKNIEKVEGGKITIKAKADEKGHLYAKIQQKEISKVIKEQLQADIPESIIELEEPIKGVGESEVKISTPDKKIKFSVFVEAK